MNHEGYTMQMIGDTFGLSKARISQILAEEETEVSPEGYRASLVAAGEIGLMELLKIIQAPVPPKISTTGRILYYPDRDVDPSGGVPDLDNPIPDISVKTDAIGKLTPMLMALSKLRGSDAVKEKKNDNEQLTADGVAYVQQVIAERNEAQQQIAQLVAKYEVSDSPS